MSGKGSRPRPFSVDHSTFSSNWDKIFGSTPSRVDQEVEALRRMRDTRTEGERQSEAWLKNEHYDQKATLICPRCGRDRFKEPCELENNFARMLKECPMKATAYTASDCWCYHCNQGRTVNGIPYELSLMILCPQCGNKRCPRATDHRLDCTNSNDPGQPGSRYQ